MIYRYLLADMVFIIQTWNQNARSHLYFTEWYCVLVNLPCASISGSQLKIGTLNDIVVHTVRVLLSLLQQNFFIFLRQSTLPQPRLSNVHAAATAPPNDAHLRVSPGQDNRSRYF